MVVRPSDWHVLDLDADPTPGQPEGVRALAATLLGFADDVDAARRDVGSLAGDSAVLDWVGLSGDTFREQFGDVPGRLDKLSTSYRSAGLALDGYWPQLATAQRRADSALEDGRVSRSQLDAAKARLGLAQDWVRQAEAEELRVRTAQVTVPAPDPAVVSAAIRNAASARDAHASARTGVTSAQGRLDAARSMAEQAKRLREDAAQTCVRALNNASNEGLHNDPWWKTPITWVKDHWDGIVQACKQVVAVLSFVVVILGGPVAWIFVAAAAVVLLDSVIKASRGDGSWWTVADNATNLFPGGGEGKAGFSAMRTLLRREATKKTEQVVKKEAEKETRQAIEHEGVGPKKARPDNIMPKTDDPIDIVGGDVLLTQTDVALPGVLPLVLTRTHVSSYRVGGWFGPSWASTLDQRVEVGPAGVHYAAPDGMLLAYPTPADGLPVLPHHGPRLALARIGDEQYTITDPARGHTLHFARVGVATAPAIRPDSAPETSTPVTLPLASVTDRNGNRIDLDYDAAGVLRSVLHAGYRIAVETVGGMITSLRLLDPGTPRGRPIVQYRYDRDRRLTKVINSSGRALRFEYDERGRMTRWLDRNGTWYRYRYDETGRAVRGEGSQDTFNTTLDYEPVHRVTRVTNSLGQTTSYHYDDAFRVVREINPLGHAVATEWDARGEPTARTDALGRTTRYGYDHAGNPASVTRPDGTFVTVDYNRLNRPTRLIDPDGAAWHYDYDERGNLTSVTDPAGVTTVHRYDDRGYLTAIVDGLGNTRHVATNAAGLPVAVTDPLGATIRYAYDPFGRLGAVIDPVGGETRLMWTVEGKLTSRTHPDGTRERWSYDAEGNLVSATDALGQVTRYESGGFDVLSARTGPDGARLSFTYDTELRLAAVTDPNGLVWSYDYDPAGNLVRETDFNGRELRYDYDAAGQLAALTNGMGQLTSFTRDALGAIIEKRAGDDVTTFVHDASGRVTAAANRDSRLTFQRDPLGRVLAETCNGRTVTSDYDALGQRTRRRTPSGAQSTWDYDAAGQPVALTTAGRSLTFGYDRAGRETERRIGDALVLAQAWDANHRLLSQTLRAANLAADPGAVAVPTQLNGFAAGRPGADADARPVARRRYTYRADGYLSEVDDQLSGRRHYDLDPAGRVTAVRAGDGTETYGYDAAGNVTDAAWLEAGPNPGRGPVPSGYARVIGEREYAGTLIRRAGASRYEHDAQGRVVLRQRKRLSAKPLTWRYTWDADDRLTGVTTPDGSRWRYSYDPFGRRIGKERLSADGADVLERIDFVWDGTVLAEQTRSGPDEPSSSTWDFYPGDFRPLTQTDRASPRDAPQEWVDERFYAIVTDLVGTPTELVTPEGEVAWHPRTTLWGAPVGENPGGVDCPLRFPGQYHDPETGLNYNYFRYYDPFLARFQSIDPLGLDPSPNPQTYVSNPMRQLDPLGLAPYKPDPLGLAPYKPAERRTFSSDDPLVSDVANEIESRYPGHVIDVNVPVVRPDGTPLTDFDIQLKNAVIQVKSGGGKGAGAQFTRTTEATDLPVIVYGPNLRGSVMNEVGKRGGLATRSLPDLLAVVAP